MGGRGKSGGIQAWFLKSSRLTSDSVKLPLPPSLSKHPVLGFALKAAARYLGPADITNVRTVSTMNIKTLLGREQANGRIQIQRKSLLNNHPLFNAGIIYHEMTHRRLRPFQMDHFSNENLTRLQTRDWAQRKLRFAAADERQAIRNILKFNAPLKSPQAWRKTKLRID